MTEAQKIPAIGLPEDKPQTTPQPPTPPGQQQEQSVPGKDSPQQVDPQTKEQQQK